jgi:hypothetical protein
VRWGIIGCGNVTEVKSGPAFNKVEGFSLEMVMRRDAAKAEDYARRHQVPRWTADADQLINDPSIDAVYIATPPSSHLSYALKVAAAGKPAYVEKPMAMSHAECVAMTDAFVKAGVPGCRTAASAPCAISIGDCRGRLPPRAARPARIIGGSIPPSPGPVISPIWPATGLISSCIIWATLPRPQAWRPISAA